MSEIKLTKRDRISVWLRSTFLQASWNYERMQNVGWAFSMIPALKRLYKTKEDRAAALKRHLEFFNTHPYLASPILGVTMSLEEKRANGAPVDDAGIQGVKVGMMGPLAGVGDPIFWGTLRPVIGAFAASLALSNNMAAPLVFFVVWNVIRMAFQWVTQEGGYKAGENITDDLGGGVMLKITTGASILGMFIMGVLVPRWTTMKFPMVISKSKLSKGSYLDFSALIKHANAGNLRTSDIVSLYQQAQANPTMSPTPYKVTTMQNVLDQILPGLMPLLLTLFCVWLLRKKVNPIVIIFGLFALGIVGYSRGIFGK